MSFIPSLVLKLATFGFMPAKLVLPAIFRVPAALIVDRLVVVLLSPVRLLAWTDLLLQQPTDIP